MSGVAGAIKAGAAYVELLADDKKLKQGLAGAGQSIRAFGLSVAKVGAGIGAIGAALLGPLLGASHVFAEMGSEMYDMSVRTGVTVEALSSLKFAAEQSGSSIGAVEVAMKKMNQTLAKADDDGSKAAETLDKLGISLDSIQGLTPDEQFRRVGKAIAKIPDQAKKTAAAIALFGKQGKALLPMIQDMEELEQQAKDLGIVMTTAEAESADALGDSFGAMQAQLKMVTFQLGAVLAPILTDIISATAPYLKMLIDWIKANHEVIKTVAKIGGILVGVGTAIIALGGVIGVVGFAFSALSTVLATIGAVLGAIISPIGLVIVGLVALGAAMVALFAPGETLAEKFTWLWDQIVAGALYVLDVVINVVATLIVAFQHWQDTLALVPVAAELAFTGVVETLKWLWENLKAFAAWLGDNWLTAFKNTFSNIWTLLKNYGTLYVDFWTAVWKKMKNPVGKFQFDFAEAMSKLTEGLVPVVEDLPKFVGRELSDAERALIGKLAGMAAPLGAEAAALAEKIKASLFGLGGAKEGGKKPGAAIPDLEASRGKVESVGTFSAAAASAGGLGAKSIGEQQLKKLEKIAEEATKTRIALELINLGVV